MHLFSGISALFEWRMYFSKGNMHYLKINSIYIYNIIFMKGIEFSLKECCICLKNALYDAKTFYNDIWYLASFHKWCAFWPEYVLILFESNTAYIQIYIHTYFAVLKHETIPQPWDEPCPFYTTVFKGLPPIDLFFSMLLSIL